MSSSIEVSFVLIDWSVRESGHTVDYLNEQSISRDRYEILWVEYFGREFSAIGDRQKLCVERNDHPAVDQWVIMGMPEHMYYHKHLAYNIGIIKSKGKIVCIMDSDSMVPFNFVESIIAEYGKNPNLVLHYDELRNFSRAYYPFNFPPIDEVERGSANLKDGKPFGLVATEDLLHQRNYGACFCALRSDLIAIGGADEHIDYLGHVCGPYDMTFRLTNAGKDELWHPNVWLYHVWHPGQAGDRNYVGPHDGLMMSTTAMAALETKRVMPLVENEFLAKLRTGGEDAVAMPFEEMMSAIRASDRKDEWVIDLAASETSDLPCHDHDIRVFSGVSIGRRKPKFSHRLAYAGNILYRTLNMLIGRGAHRTPTRDIKSSLACLGIAPGTRAYFVIGTMKRRLLRHG